MKDVLTNHKKKLTKLDYDRLLTEAVDSGVVSGRVVGLIEAYEFLLKSGFKQSAKMLKGHIEATTSKLSEAKA